MPSADVSERAYLRIGELGRRSGVNPETIRAWERRYGLLAPQRTNGGFRLYSDEDLGRVRAMRGHLDAGLAAAEAARLVLERPEPPPPTAVREPPLGELELEATHLRAALADIDAPAANASLDRLLSVFSLESILDGVIVPYLSELGERWERGEATVGEEHHASHVLRGRLAGLARGWSQGTGPRAILACAPGEQHDLGLLCFGIALRARGWRIVYLGADTPVATIAEFAARVDPAAVVVAAQVKGRLEPEVEALGAIAREHTVAIGGGGTSAALAERLNAIYLEGPPSIAAERLTERASGQ